MLDIFLWVLGNVAATSSLLHWYINEGKNVPEGVDLEH